MDDETQTETEAEEPGATSSNLRNATLAVLAVVALGVVVFAVLGGDSSGEDASSDGASAADTTPVPEASAGGPAQASEGDPAEVDPAEGGSGLSIEEAESLSPADAEAYCAQVQVIYGVEATQNSSQRLAAMSAASTLVPQELVVDLELVVEGIQAELEASGADPGAAQAAQQYLDENIVAVQASARRLAANATAVCGLEAVTGGAEAPEQREDGPLEAPNPGGLAPE